jgi:hypothetical protein
MQSDPASAHDELVERMARAMCRERHPCWSIVSEIFERDHDGQATEFRDYARAALAVARPFIRAEALEEAEDVVGEVGDCAEVGAYIDAIRAME